MEIGIEEEPYTSRLQITLHGLPSDRKINLFGNKMIAVRDGILEMHGEKPLLTWTRLAKTCIKGDQQIILLENAGWKVGQTIVIATTSYKTDESEQRIIISVTPDGKTLFLDRPLDHTHISVVETYSSKKLPMQAEVGLLSRNIVFRGDPETSVANSYGAHIMLHSASDSHTSQARIEHVELYNVGQAFKLGRYPIHFHIMGEVHESYVRGNSIYDTYNRAVTLHAVKYLKIEDNIVFNTNGHGFFTEDAIETNNYITNNLAIQIKSSWSLLASDISPSAYWIKNPNNYLNSNAAAGSDGHGFWYDLSSHPTGPSSTKSICPRNEKLGSFAHNSAHSVKKYALRVHHGHSPRT